MTLILGVANSQYAILLADRRLTPLKGSRATPDELGKCGILDCVNARVAYGFCGIARNPSGTFNAPRWLGETLFHSGPPRFTIGDVLLGLQKRATETFRTRLGDVTPRNRRFSVLVIGFHYSRFGATGISAVVTNYQDIAAGVDTDEAWNEFRVYPIHAPLRPKNEPVYAARIGAVNAAPLDEIRQEFGPLLSARKPRNAVLDFGVSYFRRVAKRPAAGNAIGERLSSIILPADWSKAAMGDYETTERSFQTFMPTLISVKPGGSFAIGEPTIEVVSMDSKLPIAEMPRVHRNAPCPCGNGKQYKKCHGAARRRRRYAADSG